GHSYNEHSVDPVLLNRAQLSGRNRLALCHFLRAADVTLETQTQAHHSHGSSPRFKEKYDSRKTREAAT
ncbi:hypothetical protein KUCAC02_002750, partial [Chaenocephalus aceratus]